MCLDSDYPEEIIRPSRRDIQLPGMRGTEAAKILHASDENRTTPIIAISAAALKADLARAGKDQFHAYLTKPIDVAGTFRIIREALQGENKDA